jgi:hypothetical protein
MSWIWSPRSGPRWWLVPTLSFAALSAVNFSFFADALFYRYDGTFILTMATAQKKWMASGIGFSLNWLARDSAISGSRRLLRSFLDLSSEASLATIIGCP